MEIDVIFAIYKRWDRIGDIMKQLREQTIDNFNVSIWNNSGKALKIDFPKERLLVFNSEKNVGTGDRWALVNKTQGDPIICFDDDEDLAPDFVEYHFKEYLKFGDKCVLGWYSKLLNPKSYRGELAIKLSYGTEVDYIGGGGSVRGRSLFEVESRLVESNFYQRYNHADDLWHSYLARLRGYRLISIEPRCTLLLDRDNENKKYKQQKEQAFQELRKVGWKMLCEL